MHQRITAGARDFYFLRFWGPPSVPLNWNRKHVSGVKAVEERRRPLTITVIYVKSGSRT